MSAVFIIIRMFFEACDQRARVCDGCRYARPGHALEALARDITTDWSQHKERPTERKKKGKRLNQHCHSTTSLTASVLYK